MMTSKSDTFKYGNYQKICKIMNLYPFKLCLFTKADTDTDIDHSSEGIGNHSFYMVS